jgi:hypothetical protein
MTLTTAAKDYIANYFGSGTPRCFVSSGISYTDPAGVAQVGSTQDVVATLKMNIGGNARGPGGEVYTDIPDWINIDDNDIIWIGNSQSGAAQYCVGAAPPPTPPTPGGVTETGPFEVTIKEGKQCSPGAPTVILDTSEARPYFNASPVLYVGVMGIDVTNVNTGLDCFGYFVWEVRMWPGKAGITCPAALPALQDISRFLAKISDKKTISITMLGTNEKDGIGASVEIPQHFKGAYTICMSLWGNHDKQALLDELKSERDYDEEIPWV